MNGEYENKYIKSDASNNKSYIITFTPRDFNIIF